MKFSDILSEAPIGDWQVDPDFDANRAAMHAARPKFRADLQHWDDPDVEAIRSAKNIQRIRNVFAKCPYTINLYFLHSEQVDYDAFLQAGEVTPAWLAKTFGPKIADRLATWAEHRAINVILTNNLSDEHKISLKSPWMLGHRVAHAIIGNKYDRVIILSQNFVKSITRIGYSIEWPHADDRYEEMMTDDYMSIFGKLLGHTIGTMNSARRGRLVTSYEWYYEMFTQYLVTGQVTLKPLPDTFDVYKLTKDPRARQKVMRLWLKFPTLMQKYCEQALREAEGKFWVI